MAGRLLVSAPVNVAMSQPHHHGRHTHADTWRQLAKLLTSERRDVGTILAFALGVGVLSVVTPAAIEALVTTVAFGVLLWPVIVLALVTLGFLAFAACLRAMQSAVAEYVQRRVFVRTARAFATAFLRCDADTLARSNPTDIVNRFLEVASVQKCVATLLVDGVQIATTTIVGLAVLAFYHPYLLVFAVVMVFLLAFLLLVVGTGGIRTSIAESAAKYEFAAWLEDLARCPRSLRSQSGLTFSAERAEERIDAYLTARRRHFSVVWRQVVFALAIEALASTALLGLGGWLVIQRQLNLGQLVAGELIVTLVLSAVSKIGKYVEVFYDLHAGLAKLAIVDQLDAEVDGGEQLPDSLGPMTVAVDAGNGEDPQRRVELAAGGHAAMNANAGSTAWLEALALLRSSPAGTFELDGIDGRSLDRPAAREQVALVGPAETFAGTVAENLRTGRTAISAADLRAALETVGLASRIARLPLGMATPLAADGFPLDPVEAARLTLARAIAGHPRLLLIDRLLDGFDLDGDAALTDSLFGPSSPWTLVVASTRDDVRRRCDSTLEAS